jgi:hypothetical protein
VCVGVIRSGSSGTKGPQGDGGENKVEWLPGYLDTALAPCPHTINNDDVEVSGRDLAIPPSKGGQGYFGFPVNVDLV